MVCRFQDGRRSNNWNRAGWYVDSKMAAGVITGTAGGFVDSKMAAGVKTGATEGQEGE